MYGPYGIQESINWLRKYIYGPSSKYQFRPAFPAQKVKLRTIKPCFEIAFVGDLMSLGKKNLVLGPKISDWLQQSEYLIANLEAPLTLNRGYFYLKQFNHPRVLDILKALKKPERIFLSVANNHGNDFGNKELKQCVQIIEESGIGVFGTLDKPSITVAEKILIHGSTEWTNTSAEGLSWFDKELRPEKGNYDLRLLFSHWGYEFELFPRPSQVELAQSLLKSWDGIIGHHSHCPQPISLISQSTQSAQAAQVVAYSLGNFAIAYTKDLLNYGLTVKLSIGLPIDSPTHFSESTDSSQTSPALVIGGLSWSFLKIQQLASQVVNVELCDECPFFFENSLPSA
jgi:hypothetical protein